MDYEIVVGLEVHAELNTQTKIYWQLQELLRLGSKLQLLPGLHRYARFAAGTE